MRDDLAKLFRARVREARPYVVGSSPGIRVKLNQNENPENIPLALRSRMQTLLSETELNRYPSEQPDSLRVLIAEYADVPADCVLVTHGSNEFVHSLCIAFVEQGRKTLIPSPTFSLFGNSVRLFGGDVIDVEADEDLNYPIDEICRIASTENPELVVIATPNNPTGKDLTLASIERVIKASSGMVVVDEAYWEFTDRPSAAKLLDKYENIIVMRTLSKAVGLAGLRIGYAIAQPDVIAELLKVRLPFMVPRIDAALAAEVLAHPERIRDAATRLKQGQRRIADQLDTLPGVSVVPSETNFVLFKTPFDSSAILEKLAQAGVLVRDMSGYRRLKGYLRVNAGTVDENTAFITALTNVLSTGLQSPAG